MLGFGDACDEVVKTPTKKHEVLLDDGSKGKRVVSF